MIPARAADDLDSANKVKDLVAVGFVGELFVGDMLDISIDGRFNTGT